MLHFVVLKSESSIGVKNFSSFNNLQRRKGTAYHWNMSNKTREPAVSCDPFNSLGSQRIYGMQLKSFFCIERRCIAV